MRTIISLAHLSLDGFLATPDRDMSFVRFDADLADHTYPLIQSVDTSVYGRVTYELMQGYWPGIAEAQPTEDTHAATHARWYCGVNKIVASRTLRTTDPKVRVVSDDIVGVLRAEKQKPGGDIMIFASPTLVQTLAAEGVVDEWRLTLQPVFLGRGLSMISHLEKRLELDLVEARTFARGVIAAHYRTKR